MIKLNLRPEIGKYLNDAKTTAEGYGDGPENKGGTREEMIKYRKADTAHQIIDDIKKKKSKPRQRTTTMDR